MDINKIEPGAKIGRWTILNDKIKTQKGEIKWFCKCECGTERYVLERSLKYGGSLSCGCLFRERAIEPKSPDLTGKVFGELTVLQRIDTSQKTAKWLCQCSCGQMYETLGTLLVCGRRTHCPSKVHKRNYKTSDIAGKKIHMLTVLYPTDRRDSKGSVIWHCKCDCGNEIDVSYNVLMYSNIKSCGCLKEHHMKHFYSVLTHVNGTSLEAIKSKKIPADNTTGYKGVYLIKGKYHAKIVFQQKQYYLGKYDNIEEAIAVRKDAEHLLFDGTAAFYEKWKAKADIDPEWASQNPMNIVVSKKSYNELDVQFFPLID